MSQDINLKIAIGSDHAGFLMKEHLRNYLSGFEVQDFGTYSSDSVDYPDFAHPVAESVEQGRNELGILVCGSANGVAITANKHQGIRAAIAWEVELAELARKHNNANIICIPARFISEETSVQIVEKFINTLFEGGRHTGRVDKISC